jgi:hypothetical protein
MAASMLPDHGMHATASRRGIHPQGLDACFVECAAGDAGRETTSG